MKIALTGFANSGKTTVFNALTGLDIPTTVYSEAEQEPRSGIVKVPDLRVDRLSEMFNPKKTTYATIEFIDYMGITPGDTERNRKVIDHFKDVDAILEVVRTFENEAVIHPGGAVNPMRDVIDLEIELILNDLDFIEKRLSRMDEAHKRGKKIDEAEKATLLKCKEILDKDLPLRTITLSESEQLSIRHLQFISVKPKIVALNISESEIGKDTLAAEIAGKLGIDCLAFCAKTEMEIAQLSPADRQDFLKDLGIDEPAADRVIKKSYELLGLISFLTAGPDEVRAWTIPHNCTALKAAGKIHSDIEKGFIKAETISFDDFIKYGSMTEAKKHGHLRLEGKSYIVKSGDIIEFKFNV